MKRIICPACWAEFEDLTNACPLCGLPVDERDDAGEARARPQPLSAEQADVAGGRLNPSLYIMVVGALILVAIAFSLQKKVNDFQRFRASEGAPPRVFADNVPGAEKPGGTNYPVSLADFAGTWRVVEGPGGTENVRFVLKIEGGRLVAPDLGEGFEAGVRGGLLRGKFSAEGQEFGFSGVLSNNAREMVFTLELGGRSAARYRAVKD